jgi:hypothetical protein
MGLLKSDSSSFAVRGKNLNIGCHSCTEMHFRWCKALPSESDCAASLRQSV